MSMTTAYNLKFAGEDVSQINRDRQQKSLSFQEVSRTETASTDGLHSSRWVLTRTSVAIAAAFAAYVPLVSFGAEPEPFGKAATTAEAPIQFDIPAQDLARALSAFTAQSRVQVLYEGDVAKGLRSVPLKGAYTPEKALKALLTGTPVQARFTGQRTVTLERKVTPVASDTNAGDALALGKVTVTAKAGYDANDPHNKDYAVPNASTATKTDTPIMETPVSVQVVTKPVLDDQQVFRVEDAVRNVSGVYIDNSFSTLDNESFVIRGFLTGNVYRDGYRFPESVSQGFRETADLSRIDVLKGPASVLYGRIDPGGIINMVTKKPLDAPYYSLQQQFGSFDLYRTTLDATGAIPNNDALSYRFNLAYQDSKSFADFVRNEHVFVAPSMRWKISDSTQVLLQLAYLSGDKVANFGVPTQPGSKRPAFVPVNFSKSEAFNNIGFEDTLPTIVTTHAFNDDWTLSHRFTADFRNTDQLETLGGFMPDQVHLNRSNVKGNRDVETYYTSLDLTGHFSTWNLRHTLLIGTDYYNTSVDSRFAFLAAPQLDIFNPVHDAPRPVFQPSDFSTTSISNEWNGVYLQDQVDLPYQFHLLAGARYDDARIEQTGTGIFGSARRDDTAFKPRVGLLWQPLRELSLYGNYAENFGSYGALGAAGLVQADGSILKPETAEQWETGIKTELFDGRLIGTLAYYELTKQNILTPNPDPSLAQQGFLSAVGEARSKGVEFDMTGEILPGWKAILAYAFTQTEITKANDTTKGNQLYNVPKHGGTVWSTYEFQEGAIEGLKLGAGVVVRSQRQGDLDNSFQLPGYATVGLMASYQWKIGRSRLVTQFNVDNLLDKRFFQNSAGFRGSSTFGAPRTFIGSMRIEF